MRPTKVAWLKSACSARCGSSPRRRWGHCSTRLPAATLGTWHSRTLYEWLGAMQEQKSCRTKKEAAFHPEKNILQVHVGKHVKHIWHTHVVKTWKNNTWLNSPNIGADQTNESVAILAQSMCMIHYHPLTAKWLKQKHRSTFVRTTSATIHVLLMISIGVAN